jgi:hypothetical protein
VPDNYSRFNTEVDRIKIVGTGVVANEDPPRIKIPILPLVLVKQLQWLGHNFT